MRDSPSVVVSTDETEASAEDYRVMMRFEERTCPYFVLGGFPLFVCVYVFDINYYDDTPARARFTSMYVVDVVRRYVVRHATDGKNFAGSFATWK